jgi:hypothetical protein
MIDSLVTSIVSEYVFLKQSEAEANLAKYEIFQKKNYMLNKNIKVINDKNFLAEKTMIEMDTMIEAC